MYNELLVKGKIYKLESIWKSDKNDKSKDINGKYYLFPKKGTKWTGQSQFIDRLLDVQEFFENKKKFIDLSPENHRDCLLCDEKKIVTRRYNVENYIWDNGLYHYILKHDIKPDNEFIELIFNVNFIEKNIVNLLGRLKTKDGITYLKLEKNQLMILDALMKHGGYTKKYHDDRNKHIVRYSEHAGFLDIRENNIHNIIVSGHTSRIDRGDEEIFLPINTPDAYKYEYIFHTHPPTPKPGGRAKDGIIYEFPSIGDILHFIEHYNDGNTIGSLVMTAEGLYNIRKNLLDKKNIKIDEDDFYENIKKICNNAQNLALQKYGTNFTTYKFYSQISQDTTFIDMINNVLKKYYLFIDFYPRIKDFKGSWIVDTIYIPIYK